MHKRSRGRNWTQQHIPIPQKPLKRSDELVAPIESSRKVTHCGSNCMPPPTLLTRRRVRCGSASARLVALDLRLQAAANLGLVHLTPGLPGGDEVEVFRKALIHARSCAVQDLCDACYRL